MRVIWDPTAQVFIAEFTQDFQGDLDAVKAAGFRPLGCPPPWIWHAPSPGVKALNRLREKRPVSGLTITQEALAVYKPLALQEEQNAAIKKQLADFKKGAKKERKKKDEEAQSREVLAGASDAKWWIDTSDLPPLPPYTPSYVVPAPPSLKCVVCAQPVYFYEQQVPPTCLWCEMHPENSA
jgi:hypothetical protein